MLGFRTRFFVNVAGRVIPLCVSLAFALFSTDPVIKWLVPFAAIAVLILVEYLGVYRPAQRFEEIVRKQFDFYFEPFVTGATFIDGTKAKIRVNLMLIRWRIFGWHLVQYYQQGMAGHPDANLHFPAYAGVCGQAVQNKSDTLVYRDLRHHTAETAKSEYKWAPKHFAITSHVRAVASVPLFRERKTFTGKIKHDCFGVLNVDAIDDVGAEFLADPIIQQQIKDYSTFVQLTLA